MAAEVDLSLLTIDRRLFQLEDNTSHATVVFQRLAALGRLTEVAELRNPLPFGARLDIVSLGDVFFFGVSKRNKESKQSRLVPSKQVATTTTRENSYLADSLWLVKRKDRKERERQFIFTSCVRHKFYNTCRSLSLTCWDSWSSL